MKRMLTQLIDFKKGMHGFNLNKMGIIYVLTQNRSYVHVCGSAFIVGLIMNSIQVP